MKYTSITDCRHCGKDTGVMTVNYVELIGHYHTVLCPDCLNDYHVFLRTHSTFKALKVNEVAQNVLFARTCSDGIDRTGELEALIERRDAIHAELYAIGEAWVTEQGRL